MPAGLSDISIIVDSIENNNSTKPGSETRCMRKR
jgi:hypothetical protein